MLGLSDSSSDIVDDDHMGSPHPYSAAKVKRAIMFSELSSADRRVWLGLVRILAVKFDFEAWLMEIEARELAPIRHHLASFPLFHVKVACSLYSFLISGSGLPSMLEAPPSNMSIDNSAIIVTTILLDLKLSPIKDALLSVLKRWIKRGVGWSSLMPLVPPHTTLDLPRETRCEEMRVFARNLEPSRIVTGTGLYVANTYTSSDVSLDVPGSTINDKEPKRNWWKEKIVKEYFDPRDSGCRLRSFTLEQALQVVRDRGSQRSVDTGPDRWSVTHNWQRSLSPENPDDLRFLRKLPRTAPMVPSTPQSIQKSFKGTTLKDICRAFGLPVIGKKGELADRIVGKMDACESEGQFNEYLERLNYFYVLEHRVREQERIVMGFRSQPGLDVGRLLPRTPDYPPLPPICPWMIREELTPPLILFRLAEQRSSEWINCDNFLAIKIHCSINTSVILNVYQAIDATLPDNRLLEGQNLRAPGSTFLHCYAGTPDGFGSESSRQLVRKNAYELRLDSCKPGQPLVVWIWGIRASDNIICQIIRGERSESSFPRIPDYSAVVNVSPSNLSPSAPRLLLGTNTAKHLGLPSTLQLDRLPRIPKAQTVQQLLLQISSTNDEMVVDSLSISLKCPVSLTLIKTPIRSLVCKHIQCFDISSLSVLIPQHHPHLLAGGKFYMNCPICSNKFYCDSLAVDEYFEDIISSTEGMDDPQTVIINLSTGLFTITNGDTQLDETSGNTDDKVEDDSALRLSDTPQKKLKINEFEITVLEERAHQMSKGPRGSSWLNPIVID